MKPRERVFVSLNHEIPDKVPIDLGGNQSSIHMRAYRRLLDFLEIEEESPRFSDIIQHIAHPCDEVLERFEVDTRYIRPPDSLLPFDHQPEREGKWIGQYDALGVFWGYDASMIHDVQDLLYLDPVIHPLEDCTTPQQIHDYDWPDGKSMTPFKDLKEEARRLRQQTDFALGTPVIGCIYEYCTFMFGLTRALRYLKKKPELIVAAMEELLVYWTDYAVTFLNEVDGNVDFVCVNGDLAEQAGPMMNPSTYERIIKPIEREFSRRVHDKANVKVNYHCCGSTPLFLDHFADIRYDAYNPVQISAHDMAPCSLKQRFGNKITFWGAACDSQGLLPFGTPEQIRNEVRRVLDCMKPHGGYIAASIHNITAEVPPENIVAMFDALIEFRDYN